jgi:hypothetical protein
MAASKRCLRRLRVDSASSSINSQWLLSVLLWAFDALEEALGKPTRLSRLIIGSGQEGENEVQMLAEARATCALRPGDVARRAPIRSLVVRGKLTD